MDPGPVLTPTDRPSTGRRAVRPWLACSILAVVALGIGGNWYRITRPEYRLARGEEAVRAGNWEAAEDYATRLESDGRLNYAHLLRGEAHQTQCQPDLALAEFNQITDDGPIRVRAAASSGKCLIQLGNLAEAARVLAFVIDEQPDHVEAHRDLAVIAYDLGQMATAVEHLEAVAKLDPADARPHRLIGLIYKDLTQFEQAAAAYREALRRGLSPTVADEVRVELGEVLARQGLHAEGLEALGTDPPGDSPPYPARPVIRAECLRGLGRRGEAAEILDRALAATPTAEAYRLRGQLYLDDDGTAGAVRVLEQAIGLAPADYQSHYLLAQAYAAAGRKDETAKAAARAENLRKDLDLLTKLSRDAIDKPWDPVVRLQLAEIADRLRKPQLAAMWRSAAAACRGPSR